MTSASINLHEARSNVDCIQYYTITELLFRPSTVPLVLNKWEATLDFRITLYRTFFQNSTNVTKIQIVADKSTLRLLLQSSPLLKMMTHYALDFLERTCFKERCCARVVLAAVTLILEYWAKGAWTQCELYQ